jgi:hypothetical protein
VAWYWVLLIIVLVQVGFLLVWWLCNRGISAEELLNELRKSTEQREREELEAERRSREAMEEAYRSLAGKQKQIQEWYNENRAKIDEETQRAYDELAVDSDAIDRKLDALLGSSPAEPTGINDPKDATDEG